MKLHFRVRAHQWSNEIQRQIERSIRFAVDRYSDRIESVAVYAANLNPSRVANVNLCQITAILKGAKPTLILERGDDLATVANRAARRLRYHIGKNLERARARCGNAYRATIRVA